VSKSIAGTVVADVTRIQRATDRFATRVATLAPRDLREPSLLPGWTRGHVVAHVARNAHALANVLRTAAGGVPTPMYPSMEARAAAIEEGAVRPLDVLLDELADGARAYAAAALAVPDGAWDTEVEWIAGRRRPASAAVPGRLREVEFHHVDLAAGYGPADWDPYFVAAELAQAAAALSGREDVPTVHLVAAETDVGRLEIAGAGDVVTVSGAAAALLAWLAGRSRGDGLLTDAGVLPTLPAWP
jgi:maleylpyruvate isomerase